MADTPAEADAAGADLVALTAGIVEAYVAHNATSSGDLAQLIGSVHAALVGLSTPTMPESESQKPAVPVRRSVTPDHIVCLEDGKQFRSLKRHLRTEHNLSPDDYREKWSLPRDYPMVAPNYSAERSRLAKDLGRKSEPAPKPRGRTRRR